MRSEVIMVRYSCDMPKCGAEQICTQPDAGLPEGWCWDYSLDRPLYFCPAHAGPFLEYAKAYAEWQDRYGEAMKQVASRARKRFTKTHPEPKFPSQLLADPGREK